MQDPILFKLLDDNVRDMEHEMDVVDLMKEEIKAEYQAKADAIYKEWSSGQER